MRRKEYGAEEKARKELGMTKLIKRAITSPLLGVITFLPDVLGYVLRRLYYKPRLKYMGEGVLLDVGVIIQNPQVVSIDSYTWIDKYVLIEGVQEVTIGKHVHVAPYSLIQGGGTVKIGDYVGISGFCRLYSASESYYNGKRMSGPTVPIEQRNVIRKPIVIGKDAFLGSNVTILPGVTVGEGAVIGANSLVTKDIPPWTIAVGIPAKPIKKRPKVRF
jgi:acetyltransferase-like isoleucine patch superfamily enzyme